MKIRIGDVIRVKEKDKVDFHFYEVAGYSRDFIVTFQGNQKIQNKNIIDVFRYKNGTLERVDGKRNNPSTSVGTVRNLLKLSAVEEFKTWLLSSGWELQEMKSEYEVLRIKSPKGHSLVLYLPADTRTIQSKNTHNGEVYVTVNGVDVPTVNEFIYNNK